MFSNFALQLLQRFIDTVRICMCLSIQLSACHIYEKGVQVPNLNCDLVVFNLLDAKSRLQLAFIYKSLERAMEGCCRMRLLVT